MGGFVKVCVGYHYVEDFAFQVCMWVELYGVCGGGGLCGCVALCVALCVWVWV